jgi:hypothetical protein
MNALVPRATIEDVVRYRNQTIGLYETAFDKIEEAHEALEAAREMAARCHPGVTSYNYDRAQEIDEFNSAVRLPRKERYLRTARRLTDINAWSWIIQRTELEKLMDHQAKEELRTHMRYVPERTDREGQLINEEEMAKGLPDLTVENIMATLERFRADSAMIFQRGIANVFSKLDRRFRSHDGFKIGSRIILTRCFNDWGSLNYGETRNMLIDVERVFAILDGHPEGSFAEGLNALEDSRRGGGLAPRQSECDTPYFKIRGFKNGNAHLWFVRDDLTAKVNKLLGDYYGEVIGDGQQAEEDPLNNIKNTPAKRYGFFPTPDPAAQELMGKVPTWRMKDQSQLRILEPSAGTGNLARRCIHRPEDEDAGYRREQYRFDNLVDCVEIQPHLADALTAEGIYNRVWTANFLALKPEETGLYDLIVMNPPFDRERDIDHVCHALRFLKPDGVLYAIMSAGTEFRETKKSIAFRKLVLDSMKGSLKDLPAGSFAEVGTYVNTVMLRVRRDGKDLGRWW